MTPYAKTIREALDEQRRHGAAFGVAWRRVLAQHPAPEGWPPVLAFMEQHFRAAYNRDLSRRGRCRVEGDGTPNRAGVRSAPLGPRTDVLRCKSWDGCDRPATRGRFGPKWCERHGAELERISATMGQAA